MLGGNVLILKIISFLESALEKLVHGLGKGSLCHTSAGDLGEALDLAVHLIEHCLHANADLLDDGRNDAFAVFKQGGEQMHRQQLRIAVLGGQVVFSLPMLTLICFGLASAFLAILIFSTPLS